MRPPLPAARRCCRAVPRAAAIGGGVHRRALRGWRLAGGSRHAPGRLVLPRDRCRLPRRDRPGGGQAGTRLGLVLGYDEDFLADQQGGKAKADGVAPLRLCREKLGVFMLSADVLDGIATLNTTRNTGGGRGGRRDQRQRAGRRNADFQSPAAGNFSAPARGRAARGDCIPRRAARHGAAGRVRRHRPATGSTSLRPDLNPDGQPRCLSPRRSSWRPRAVGRRRGDESWARSGQAVSVAGPMDLCLPRAPRGRAGAAGDQGAGNMPRHWSAQTVEAGSRGSFEERKEKLTSQKAAKTFARFGPWRWATSTAHIGTKVFLPLFVHKEKRFSTP